MMTPVCPRLLNMINDFVLLRFWARASEDLTAIEVIDIIIIPTAQVRENVFSWSITSLSSSRPCSCVISPRLDIIIIQTAQVRENVFSWSITSLSSSRPCSCVISPILDAISCLMSSFNWLMTLLTWCHQKQHAYWHSKFKYWGKTATRQEEVDGRCHVFHDMLQLNHFTG